MIYLFCFGVKSRLVRSSLFRFGFNSRIAYADRSWFVQPVLVLVVVLTLV
jgi:hypothetical protein